MKENKIYFKPGKLLLTLILSSFLVTLTSPLSMAQNQNITFSLGKKGQSGCLVCHGDKNLVKITPEGKKSLYIDPVLYNESVHKNTPCQGCHLSFASEPHQTSSLDYKKEAGLSCKERGCHERLLAKYAKSIHGKLALSKDPKGGATCGDCHGSHGIAKAKSETYRASAKYACGRKECHEKFWNNYDDHYHGRPYKLGEPDAPPCWDCHGSHQIVKYNDPDSPAAKKNLYKSCNKCHKVVTREDKAFLDYAVLIHSRSKVEKKNFLKNLLIQAVNYLDYLKDTIKQLIHL